MLLREWSDPDVAIYQGDCRQVLCGQMCGSVDLFFADPPFNQGEDYGTWDDSVERSQYLDFTWQWVNACLHALAPHGSIFINVPDHIAAEIAVHMKSQGMHMVNWIIWHFRFGVWRPGNFIGSKTHCLYFCKDPKNRIWNGEEILVPSDRATKYKDRRTLETANPGLRPPLDVWCGENDGANWGRVTGNSKERRPLHPNQLPEAYLTRIIKAASRPGDLVLDPFAGSGTTATVARALGRRAITIEIDPKMAASAAERIEAGPARFLGIQTKD